MIDNPSISSDNLGFLDWLTIDRPGSPTTLHIEKGVRCIVVNWQALSTPKQPVQEYVLSVTPGDTRFIFNGDKQKALLLLPAGVRSCTVSVYARNLAGDSLAVSSDPIFISTRQSVQPVDTNSDLYALADDLLLLDNITLASLLQSLPDEDVALLFEHIDISAQQRLSDRILSPEQKQKIDKRQRLNDRDIEHSTLKPSPKGNASAGLTELRVQRSVWPRRLVWIGAVCAALFALVWFMFNPPWGGLTTVQSEQPDLNATVEAMMAERLTTAETQKATAQANTPQSQDVAHTDPLAMSVPVEIVVEATATATPTPSSTPTTIPTSTPTNMPANTPTSVPADTPVLILTNTPVPLPTPTRQPEIYARPNVDRLNLRNGPGEAYNVIGAVTPDDLVLLTARDPEGTWMYMTSSAQAGWIAGWLLDIEGDAQSLPILIPPEPVSTPTASS